MSNRERAVSIIDSFPEEQIGNVIAILQAMKQELENARSPEIPNAVTIAAMEEVNEMIRTGSGQGWTGGTKELFQQILEEGDESC